jgi:hypothetical protein
LEIHNVSMIPRLNMGFPAATLQSQKHQVSGWKYLNREKKTYPILLQCLAGSFSYSYCSPTITIQLGGIINFKSNQP